MPQLSELRLVSGRERRKILAPRWNVDGVTHCIDNGVGRSVGGATYSYAATVMSTNIRSVAVRQ